jgi:DNA excision repair protein ERCC-4
VCRVVVDVHEGVCGVVRALQDLGCDVECAPLRVGDYVVARGVVVERKTVRDLHLSVLQGRFWRQVGTLRAAVPRPYLLIEGVDLDAGPLAPNAVRGVCLAVLEQGVPILRSSDTDDSALWLARLARRSLLVRPASDRPVYDQRPAPRRAEASEAALAAVPGISVVLARRLLDRFGTVSGVIAAGPSQWRTVPGMGATRAAALESVLLH